MGVVERGPLLGREQEWNISEAELEEMVEANVLSKEVEQGMRRVCRNKPDIFWLCASWAQRRKEKPAIPRKSYVLALRFDSSPRGTFKPLPKIGHSNLRSSKQPSPPPAQEYLE